MAGNLDIPQGGQPRRTQDRPIREGLETLNGLLGPENKIALAGLEDEAKPADLTWYTPKIIATEETRESTSFGTLATADQIKEVVVPEGGQIKLSYAARWKSSVASAGRAAIFLGSNQVQGVGGGNETSTQTNTNFWSLGTVSQPTSSQGMMVTQGEVASIPTTGVAVGETTIFGAAGTYSVSIQFRATSGSVTAKERKLWVTVLGPKN